MRSKRVAVIGAGISGLSAAYELKRRGFDVVVLEKYDMPGGRMCTKDEGGLLFDMGADFLIDGWYTLLRSYAEELGVRWVRSQPGGRPRVVRGGKPYYIDVVGAHVLTFDLLSFRARMRFFLFLFRMKFFAGKLSFLHLSHNPEELESITAAEYLTKYVHKEVLDYIGDPFTAIMQFHRADEISAAALCSLIQEMMNTPGGFRVAYTPGGMGMIPRALAEKVGVRYGVDVVSVASRGDSVEVVHGRGAEIFDAVVMATTGDVAHALVKTHHPASRALFEELRYASTITVAYKIPPNLFADGAHLNYVPFVESQIISGYDNTVRKDPAAIKDETSIMNVYLYENAAREYVSKSDADVFDVVKKELTRVCPEAAQNFESVVPFDLKRWSHAMPKFTGALSRAVRAFEKEAQGEGNIFFTGDYLNSPWTEGAARCGKRVAGFIEDKFRV